MKFRKKPVEVEAITFDEFVEYGKNHTQNIINGMPWSFKYNGHEVTHEDDQCYIVPTLEGNYKFTPDDMLITGVKGEIYPCKLDIFEKTYEPVDVPCNKSETITATLYKGYSFRDARAIYDDVVAHYKTGVLFELNEDSTRILIKINEFKLLKTPNLVNDWSILMYTVEVKGEIV
jgi:hypothetical protein